MNTIITLGTFDLPHYGHYRLLQRCKEIGNTIVGLNTDEFITRYKGKPPIMTYRERDKTIQEWGFDCVPNSQDDGTIKTCIEEVEKIYSPVSHIVVGSDWLEKDYLKQIGLDRQYLYDEDISILFVPYTEGISTTELKRRIKDA